MTDREIALDIAEKWLNAEPKITTLEAFLDERLPEWLGEIRSISSTRGLTPRQQLVVLQHAFDEDKSGDSAIRILHQALFEK
jgi:hypothetical protein